MFLNKVAHLPAIQKWKKFIGLLLSINLYPPNFLLKVSSKHSLRLDNRANDTDTIYVRIIGILLIEPFPYHPLLDGY